MKEHGGQQQTNKRALNTLERFPAICEAILSSHAANNPMKSMSKKILSNVDDLAKKYFELIKLIESQKKINSEKFLDLLLDFVLAWDATFPDVP